MDYESLRNDDEIFYSILFWPITLQLTIATFLIFSFVYTFTYFDSRFLREQESLLKGNNDNLLKPLHLTGGN